MYILARLGLEINNWGEEKFALKPSSEMHSFAPLCYTIPLIPSSADSLFC